MSGLHIFAEIIGPFTLLVFGPIGIVSDIVIVMTLLTSGFYYLIAIRHFEKRIIIEKDIIMYKRMHNNIMKSITNIGPFNKK